MAKGSRTDVEQEVGAWVAEYGDRLVHYAWVLVRDPQEAQDVAQEAFLRLYRWRAGAGASRPVTPALLYRITQRLALDHLRRPTRPPSLDETATDGDYAWESEVVARLDVEAVLAQLSWSDRAAIWLFYFDGWTTEDIAGHLGVTRANVRGRLFRARQRFLKAWTARDGREGSGGAGQGAGAARKGQVTDGR